MTIQTAGFAVTIIVLAIQHASASDCNFLINGRVHTYRHGEMFTIPGSPCQVHRCENGRDSVMKQGCEFEGQCRDIGSRFVGTSCATYTCTMPYRNHFMVTPIRGGCKDVYNSCRQPGETFAYNDNGIYRASCQCEVHGTGTKYRCQA